jgi:hypothetical protein
MDSVGAVLGWPGMVVLSARRWWAISGCITRLG